MESKRFQNSKGKEADCNRSPEQFGERIDHLITQIVNIQKACMNGEAPADILVVSLNSMLN